MKQGDTTTIFQTGKITYVLFPEVYFKFVSALHNQHKDILQAMVLAQVKVDDNSAFDFLNTLLGTNVNKNMPMEIGYAQLLDALNMRSINSASQAAIERVAKQFGNHANFPHRSNPEKPIFPDEKEPKQ
jgi:hypothetical protein